jgi:hypothetical protein
MTQPVALITGAHAMTAVVSTQGCRSHLKVTHLGAILTPAAVNRRIAHVALLAGVGMPSGVTCAKLHAHPMRRSVQSMQLAARVGMAPTAFDNRGTTPCRNLSP